MPNTATVSGILQDATLSPVSGGKVIASLVGTDIFDGGTVRIVTQKVEATTDATGAWSLDLIVNGEGENASSTWALEGFNQYVTSVFKLAGIFVPVAIDANLGDLEKTSVNNIKAAKDGITARLITVTDYAEYAALPVAQKFASDIIIVTGA